MMKDQNTRLTVTMQVGSELRLKKTGDIAIDNPEIELAADKRAADAVLSCRFDPATGEHILRLLDPVADHRHSREHRPDE